MNPFGITPQQYNVLRILKGKFPGYCSADEIKEVMIDNSPDLTRLIDRMMEKGYVTREVCEENRRKLEIGITEKGLKLISNMEPELQALGKQLSRISSAEANELSRILDKMRG